MLAMKPSSAYDGLDTPGNKKMSMTWAGPNEFPTKSKAYHISGPQNDAVWANPAQLSDARIDAA